MVGAMADVDPFELAIRSRKDPRHGWIARLAARQHGVVTHSQLVAGGSGRSAIQRLISAGWLHPLHVGAYAVGHRNVSWPGRCMAAVLACGPDAVLSHQPAAGLWEVRRTASAALHVTVPRPRKGPRGVNVHSVRSLHPDDIARVDGIPVTSLPRTFLDNAEVLPVRQVVRMMEEAERRQIFDLRAVERLLRRSHGRHGLKALQAALAQLTGEPPHINSDWERDLLDFCDDFDIPRPELNVTVEGYVVDALWRHAKLIVELDSWSHRRRRRCENRVWQGSRGEGVLGTPSPDDVARRWFAALRDASQPDVGVMLQGLPDRPVRLTQRAVGRARVVRQRPRESGHQERVRLLTQGEGARLAARAHDPAVAENAPRCSRSPHEAQAASSGAKPEASRSFSRNVSACARTAAPGSASSNASSCASRLYAGRFGSVESSRRSTASHAWVARSRDARRSRRAGWA
jgi:hypothetical protein